MSADVFPSLYFRRRGKRRLYTFAFLVYVLARCTCVRTCMQGSIASLEIKRGSLEQVSSHSGWWGDSPTSDCRLQDAIRHKFLLISFFKWRIPSVFLPTGISRHPSTFFFLIYFIQEEMKKEFVEITLPAQLQKLEAILKDHNEGKGFFLGDKVGE